MREQIPGDAWDGNEDEEYNRIRFHLRELQRWQT